MSDLSLRLIEEQSCLQIARPSVSVIRETSGLVRSHESGFTTHTSGVKETWETINLYSCMVKVVPFAIYWGPEIHKMCGYYIYKTWVVYCMASHSMMERARQGREPEKLSQGKHSSWSGWPGGARSCESLLERRIEQIRGL